MGKALKKSSNKKIAAQWTALMQSNYGTPTVGLDRGKGAEVWDVEGKKYLDFLGGIATNILGHNNPEITSAVAKACHMAGVVILTAGTYGNVIRFLPPLTIGDDLLLEALDVLEEQFVKLAK